MKESIKISILEKAMLSSKKKKKKKALKHVTYI